MLPLLLRTDKRPGEGRNDDSSTTDLRVGVRTTSTLVDTDTDAVKKFVSPLSFGFLLEGNSFEIEGIGLSCQSRVFSSVVVIG